MGIYTIDRAGNGRWEGKRKGEGGRGKTEEEREREYAQYDLKSCYAHQFVAAFVLRKAL